MTYLDVRLKVGERWTFRPPQGHDVAWIASHQGTVTTTERISAGELAVFEESDRPIQFEALSDTGFVLGSAVKHPYDLVTGHYSVHTNADSLRIGEKNISEIGRRLHNQGCPWTRGTLKLPFNREKEKTHVWNSFIPASTTRRGGYLGAQERSERRSPLRPEHFPVQADGRDIVAQDGHRHRRRRRRGDERGDRAAPEQDRLERPGRPVAL